MLKMWYEYDWALQDRKDMQGHYETENKQEIIKRLITTFSDMIDGQCTCKMLENKVIDGEQYCNIYVKYKYSTIQTAKFGNVPIKWGGQIDDIKIFNND